MKKTHIVSLAILLTLSGNAFSQAGNRTDLLDVNTASADALREASSSDTLVEQVQAGRPYLNAVQLDAVLGDSVTGDDHDAFYRKAFRQINLNTASRKEIMLIPGMSRKMAREFEEYRPYTSPEQFRREIGKYVDQDEVARLESYVTLE